MKHLRILPGLGAALLLAGCVVSSLNPIYTPDSLALEPRVLGTWLEEDGTWSFEKKEANSYRSTWSSGDESAHFETHFCRIGDHLFMDLYPEKPHPGEDLFMIPTHTFARVSVEGETMRVSFLDQQWLEEKLETGEVSVPHAIVEGRPILTGSTSEVRSFLLAYASNEEAFGAAMQLSRQTPAGQR